MLLSRIILGEYMRGDNRNLNFRALRNAHEIRYHQFRIRNGISECAKVQISDVTPPVNTIKESLTCYHLYYTSRFLIIAILKSKICIELES